MKDSRIGTRLSAPASRETRGVEITLAPGPNIALDRTTIVRESLWLKSRALKDLGSGAERRLSIYSAGYPLNVLHKTRKCA